MSFDTPDSSCPYCDHRLDKALNTAGARGPRKGDFSVCIKCGGWLVFNKDLTVRAITVEELATMTVEERGQLIKTTNAVRKIPDERNS